MTRIAGVVVLLAGLYGGLYYADPVGALGRSNLFDVANRQGLYGVLTLGAAVLIVAGGIDLSIGSVVGMTAVLFGVLMLEGVTVPLLGPTGPVPPLPALVVTVLCGAVIGLVHGLLVTRLRLQAFLVTLCGLFVYRGVARMLTRFPVGIEKVKRDHPEFGSAVDGLRFWLAGLDPDGKLLFPAQLLVAVVLAVVVGVVLHKTAYGRAWYAIGYNDKAAAYAGVNVGAARVVVFVLCSTLAALGGCMLLLAYGTAMPENAGESFELYAITGAVLGGCSLRGGEGNAGGMLLGAAVLPLLRNLVVFLGIRDAIIPAIIGLTLLGGVVVDEGIRGGGVGRVFGRLGRRPGP